MRFSPNQPRLAALALVLAAGLVAGCTDTVFKERAPFNPPPDAASGFMGYYTTATKQTTCGNCHAEKQAQWATTAHSHAWEDLQNSGHASSFCFPCHSVSANGNDATGTVGYIKTPSPAYQDVQCESCHGPGQTHVTSPTLANRPLARISVSDTTNSCTSCHSGTHDPFFEEWSASGHGQSNTLSPPISNIATNGLASACAPCHEARTVLKLWGVNTNYVEANDVITAQSALPITCAVCHDPHDSTNPGQLRYPLANVSLTGQLCIKCHSRVFDVQLTRNTPHAPQGPVVLGTAGYWPPGFDTSFTPSSHGDLTKNPRLCAGCHVNSYQGTDSNGVTTFSVGHLFRPIPCIVNGSPVIDNSCAYDLPSRTWQACSNAACHGSQTAAQQAFASDTAALTLLTRQLWVDANHNGKLDSFPVDSGYLAQASKFVSTTDSSISVADGVMFNVNTFGLRVYSNGDKSLGVHNPFLYQAILAASITAMKNTYGLSAPPPNVQVIVDRALARVGKRPPVVVSQH